MFYEFYKLYGLPLDGYVLVLPYILKDLAQNYYYNTKLGELLFQDIYNNLQKFFESLGFYRKNLAKQNLIIFESVIKENPEKSIKDSLLILVNKLKYTQYSLRPKIQDVNFLYNKLIITYEKIPAYKYTVLDPPETLGALINKL